MRMAVAVQGASWTVRTLCTGGLHMAGTYYFLWSWIFGNGEPRQASVKLFFPSSRKTDFGRKKRGSASASL